MICIKRDGREVEFKEERIENAVALAYLDVHPGMEEEAHRLGKSVASSVRAWFEEIGVDKPTVEQIQDVVEEHLSASYFDVAKKYILYRDTKAKKRESKNDMLKMIEEKAFGLNDEKKNANVDEKSFGGRFGEVAETILRELALKMVSKITRENHENNMVYTHDFAHYPLGDHNCLTIPIDPLMKNGFKTRQVDIRPPKTFGTFGQLSAVLAQLQSLQQFGGVSYGHYDHSSVPYVRMSFLKHYNKALDFIKWIKPLTLENVEEVSITDKIYRGHWWNFTKRIRHHVAMARTKEEVHQAIEALFHNLNSLQSRSGNQLPFSSLNYGTCTLEEGRMVTKAILEVSIDGLGKHGRTSVFPCQIFQIGEGINKHSGDPNYDLFRLALKSTAKRLYPNYANVDWSNNEGYDKNDPNTYFGTMG